MFTEKKKNFVWGVNEEISLVPANQTENEEKG